MALQRLDLLRRDRAAAAHDDADVLAAALAQHVHHVGEVLVVAALIGARGDRVRVLLDGRPDDLRHAAVVAEMNDLGAMRLQQAADHVDRRIVAVEERGRGDESERRARPAGLGLRRIRGLRQGLAAAWAPVLDLGAMGMLACKLAAEGILYLYAPVEWLPASMVQRSPFGST